MITDKCSTRGMQFIVLILTSKVKVTVKKGRKNKPSEPLKIQSENGRNRENIDTPNTHIHDG